MSKTLPILFFRGWLYWGYSIQVTPFSKTRLCFRLPPPTSLIGALSYPLALELGKPEVKDEASWADELNKVVAWCSARLVAPMSSVTDMSRVYWYYFNAKESKTDAFAVEKIYVSGEEPCLDVVIVVREDRAKEFFGGSWEKHLEAAAWSVVRIGQKESLFSSYEVRVDRAVPTDSRVARTSFYFPSYLARRVEGSSLIEFFVRPGSRIGDYTSEERVPYVVPYDEDRLEPASVKVELSDEGAVINLPIGDSLIVDRRVVAGVGS